MKTSMATRVKKSFHGWLLRKIYSLPRFQGGAIADFQQMHQRNIDAAKTFYERRKPPVGARVDLKSIRIVEVFDIDHFNDFMRGLHDLFIANDKIQKIID